MARKKRTSAVLETARKRLAGLKSIDKELDLGSGLSVAAYTTKAGGLEVKLDSHNQILSTADESSNAVDDLESDLNEYNRRILSAVEAKYGPDSSEYEMCGGTRKSERKKPTKKTGGGSTPPTP